MNELDVYKRAYGNVVNQNAQLSADLGLAHAQIDMLNEQLEIIKKENTDKEKDSE